MSDTKEVIEDMLNSLKLLRDDLEVKTHLATVEADNEWKKLEETLQELKTHGKTVAEATGDSANNVDAALELVAELLQNGYGGI